MGRLLLHILADSGQRVYRNKCRLQAISTTFPPPLHIGAYRYPVSLNQRVPGSSPGAPTIDPVTFFAVSHQTIAEQFEARFEK
jgi:hypothetical protein